MIPCFEMVHFTSCAWWRNSEIFGKFEKEPPTSGKEPYISAKKTWMIPWFPRISQLEYEPRISEKRTLYIRKRDVDKTLFGGGTLCARRDGTRKWLVYSKKSPVYPEKKPICSEKSPIYPQNKLRWYRVLGWYTSRPCASRRNTFSGVRSPSANKQNVCIYI